METLKENEHKLITPSFIGTDEEKITTLNYWLGMITHLRSLNSIVISFENKISIINQLKIELNIIDNEVNNVSSVPTPEIDGSVEMSNLPVPPDVANGAIVDLTVTESKDPFKRVISDKESIQKLAGNWKISK